ncbi:hypothetical protein ACDX78_06440 [Virgibacillus oceani]
MMIIAALIVQTTANTWLKTSKEEMKGMKRAARHHWTFGLLFSIGMWAGGFLL